MRVVYVLSTERQHHFWIESISGAFLVKIDAARENDARSSFWRKGKRVFLLFDFTPNFFIRKFTKISTFEICFRKRLNWWKVLFGIALVMIIDYIKSSKLYKFSKVLGFFLFFSGVWGNFRFFSVLSNLPGCCNSQNF